MGKASLRIGTTRLPGGGAGGGGGSLRSARASTTSHVGSSSFRRASSCFSSNGHLAISAAHPAPFHDGENSCWRARLAIAFTGPSALIFRRPVPAHLNITRIWLQRLGFLSLLLLGSLVPLFLYPVPMFPAFDTERAEQIVAKLLVMQGLSAIAIVCGALTLALRGKWSVDTLGRIILWAAGGFALWGIIGCMSAPSPMYSLKIWMPRALAIAAVLVSPLLLQGLRNCRWVVLAIVVAGTLSAGIGTAGSLGVRSIYRATYGTDPRDEIESSNTARRMHVEGGAQRSASIGTLANPEYAGSYTSVIAAIVAVMLFDWAPRSRRHLLARALVLGILALLLLYLAFTGSRQPWVSLVMAGLFRFVYWLGVPILPFAACILVFLVTLPAFGAAPAGLAFAAGLFLLMAIKLRPAEVIARIKSADRLSVAMLTAGPLLILVLLINFSIPSPFNPTGMRLFERFASATNRDDDSLRQRLGFFMLASHIVREAPMFGCGAGTYASAYRRGFAALTAEDETAIIYSLRDELASKIPDHSHNDYMQTAAENGVPALILLLTVIMASCARMHHLVRIGDAETRLVAFAVLIGLATLAMSMLTSFPLQTPSRAAVFWVLIALAACMPGPALPEEST